MTNREQVLATLAMATLPLDDDEVSRRTGIRPRQTINQICNRLSTEGMVLRVAGPDGKIVNSLAARPGGADLVSTELSGTELTAGSSHEQQAAESLMLVVLSDALGVSLAPRRIRHSGGARVEVDGADTNLTVLVECWAHQGPAKVAQKYKLVNDATKLHWIAGTIAPAPERLILCVSDEAAVRHLRGKSWQGQAIASLGIEIHVVELPPEIVASISEAQKRQFR